MVKQLAYSFAWLGLAALVANPALAAKTEKRENSAKKAGDIAIKALEDQIDDLQEHEKVALKLIDDKYQHIIRFIEPKEVHARLEAVRVDLHHVHAVISTGDFDYGGRRRAALESVKHAEHQVETALAHDTPQERHNTAAALHDAYVGVEKALAYSNEKYGTWLAKDKGEPESRATANIQLAEALPKIQLAHQLLAAVDHEITDYKEERRILREKHDVEKDETKEAFKVKVKELEGQIRALTGK